MRCIRDVYGSEVQGEVHTRAGSILRIGSGSRLGVHDIPIRVQKRGLVPPLDQPLKHFIVNRPGVAGAVLQTPLSLIN